MIEILRRVVTGHNDAGRSVIIKNGAPENIIEIGGNGLGELWEEAFPPNLDGNEDRAPNTLTLEPAKGAIKFRYFMVPPQKKDLSTDERAAMEDQAAQAFALVGAAHARVDTSRHPSMHKTESLDFIAVLRGSVTLLLDEGDVELMQGDTVIQRATNHAWANYGTEPALMLAVLINRE